jgi:Fe-S oxidoreductase
MWVDIPGPRLAEIRVRDAVEAGAEILATACPYCLLTFEDAVKTTGSEGKIQAMDIAELLTLAT